MKASSDSFDINNFFSSALGQVRSAYTKKQYMVERNGEAVLTDSPIDGDFILYDPTDKE